MDMRKPNTSANKTIPQTTLANIPEEYLTNGARYADRRGRSGGMAELGNISGASNKSEVLYPATSKLHGALLASLITSKLFSASFILHSPGLDNFRLTNLCEFI